MKQFDCFGKCQECQELQSLLHIPCGQHREYYCRDLLNRVAQLPNRVPRFGNTVAGITVQSTPPVLGILSDPRQNWCAPLIPTFATRTSGWGLDWKWSYSNLFAFWSMLNKIWSYSHQPTDSPFSLTFGVQYQLAPYRLPYHQFLEVKLPTSISYPFSAAWACRAVLIASRFGY